MKTTTYKIGNVMRSIIASLIILASFSGIANGGNSSKEAVNAETVFLIEEYNAKNFVDAEMALEIQNSMNTTSETNNEVVEAEPALQIAALMNINEYKAEKFVDAEMALELESWMNKSGSKEQTIYGTELANN